jgi:hypothetical protein
LAGVEQAKISKGARENRMLFNFMTFDLYVDKGKQFLSWKQKIVDKSTLF